MKSVSPQKLIMEKVKQLAKEYYEYDADFILIEHPDNPFYGDYSTNIGLQLSKALHQNPMDIAKGIVYELQNQELQFKTSDDILYPIFKNIEAVSPGFINFTLSDDWLKNNVLTIVDDKEAYGSNSYGADKNIIIEFSQPNPNKPMHIGHSRNNFIGSSLSEIFSFSGYNVSRTNYMNDWGTHICKSMLMYQKFGDNKDPNTKEDHFLGDFYIMYEVEHEKNPQQLELELANLFKKLESHDPDTIALWKKVVGWAYKGWESTYEDENVEFDVWMYQSNYTEAGKDIVNLALQKKIAEKDSTGAIIARLEKYNIPDKVLLRSDGTSIYITQDMQLAKDSYEKYAFTKRLYVVDNRQSDYFKQLFKILEILGFEWFDRLFHVAYGMVSLPEGAMSSRKGNVVYADDVYSKIVEVESDEISSSIKEITSKDETIKKVALAAFRYGILKVDPKQDIVFKLDQVTKFEGNTGPYILYSYARAKSILEKAGYTGVGAPVDFAYIKDVTLEDKERELLRILYMFPEIVEKAAETFAPNEIANYVYKVAQVFNSFYSEIPILNSKDSTKDFRLAITLAASQVIKNALFLLRIPVVEKM